MDYAWHFVQPNDVGFDELMTLCKLLNVDPYITVNAGLGDADSAADLVEYANGSVTTPMGALRARNGHREPYHVKFWNIGNEMYGYWQIGHTALKYYTLKHNQFSIAMRKVDPSITILASGATPDEMTITGNSFLATGKVQPEYGSQADWDGGLLAIFCRISMASPSTGTRKTDCTSIRPSWRGRTFSIPHLEIGTPWCRSRANRSSMSCAVPRIACGSKRKHGTSTGNAIRRLSTAKYSYPSMNGPTPARIEARI